jgi:hypothetical protein
MKLVYNLRVRICRQFLIKESHEQFSRTVDIFFLLDMSLISRSCKNDHIIFNVGTPSLEARNIRLVNIITYIIEESKLISENMSPNVIHC